MHERQTPIKDEHQRQASKTSIKGKLAYQQQLLSETSDAHPSRRDEIKSK
jgi:hypothetical protein